MSEQMYRIAGRTELADARKSEAAARQGRIVWEASDAEQADWEFRNSNERDEWGRKVHPRKTEQ